MPLYALEKATMPNLWYKLKITFNRYVLRYYEVGASSVHQGLSWVVLQAARPAAQASQRLASEEPVSCCGQDLLSKYREGSHWFPGRDGKFRNLQMNARKFRHYYIIAYTKQCNASTGFPFAVTVTLHTSQVAIKDTELL